MEGSVSLRQRVPEFMDAGPLPLSPERPRAKRRSEILQKLRKWRGFMLVVALPTLLSAVYFFAIAADQYESEAHFVVKTASQSNSGFNSGLAQMFGLGAGLNPSQSESLSVGDYLTSHDAVAALQRRMDLTAMFRRPEADVIARLWYSEPMAEDLARYYRRQVKVNFSSDTGITTLAVRAFRPEDAHALTEALLEFGEQRVNMLNQRAVENALKVAERQLDQAEAAVTATQTGMTDFRQGERDIDPQRTSTAQITVVSDLQRQLAIAQAQLSTMKATLDPKSPQFMAQTERVRALDTQVRSQASQLAGGDGSMAPTLSAYEALRLRQDFAAKRYEAAASALQGAREQALRQQLYVVRIVEPNLAQKALYPKRWLTVFATLVAALLIYGVGTLLVAGVREHVS
ncbi:capsule biosynthesis protein [Hyphomicrobium sp. CS1BSMeth3]|uniref:capsule biosynthesis protein n=1 Tax=Hyphomicrobium sp. CS1BSMeth3 TaxID=1892844 RepID=UPI0015774A7A|nr:capsule biosynthesis protein [Hyphomicrobium sp. CS1BSMeth3]